MRSRAASWIAQASILVLSLVMTSRAEAAHSAFKKALQSRYELAGVACSTCHVSDTKRDERNELGEMFHERLKDQNLTEKFYAARKRGFQARRDTEKVMTREFLQVLKNVEPIKSDNGVTFGERFRRAQFPGLRLR